MVTALARSTIRAAAVRQPKPTEILTTLNEVLLHHHTDRYCTVGLIRLRQRGARWMASVVAGGHPLPIRHRPGEPARTVGRFGSLIGMLSDPAFHETEVELRPGDTLVLHTDGITEARRGGEQLGDAWLHAAVARHAGTAAAVTEGVLEEVLEFQDGDSSDDIVVMAVRLPDTA